MNFRTSLKTKLLLTTVGALGVVMLAALIGIAGLWASIKTFNETSHASVGQERTVRDMTVQFKEQVQEWKDVLLRGKDPAALDKYWTGFTEKEAAIDKSGKQLIVEMADPKARELVKQFLTAHREMGQAYRRGLQAYKDAGFASAAGDAAVTGIDLAPTQLLEDAVETAEQLAALQAIGCHEIQGYFVSRPLPAAELAAFVGVQCLPGEFIARTPTSPQ